MLAVINYRELKVLPSVKRFMSHVYSFNSAFFHLIWQYSKQARTIIVSKATRVTAQALYNHRGRKC